MVAENPVAGKYTQADMAAIQRIANASIRDATSEEFPGLDPDDYTVSMAQIRHVLTALELHKKRNRSK